MSRLAGLLLLSLALSIAVRAQDRGAAEFPNRPLNIVVTQGPGGGTDTEVRTLQPYIAKYLGQTVVVENRPGASGIIGADVVARTQPDGYTLLYVASTFSIAAASHRKLPFDPAKDFSYIGKLAERSNVIVVGAKSPIKTAAEYLQFARDNPGEIKVGGSGPGATIHLGFALLHSMAGSKVTYVHYKSVGQRIVDLISGRIDTTLGGLGGMRSHLQAGTIRALAVTTSKRLKSIPEVPTMAEAGVAGYNLRYWTGFGGPAGISPAIVAKLNAVLAQVAMDPDLIRKLEADGGEMGASTPKEFRSLVLNEIGVFKKVISDNGIVVE